MLMIIHAMQLSMLYCPGKASQRTAAHRTLAHMNGAAQICRFIELIVLHKPTSQQSSSKHTQAQA